MHHYISKGEIRALKPGRLLDVLVEEYFFNRKPQIWSSSQKGYVAASWFQSKPRQIAEEDVQPVCASVPYYSKDEKDTQEVHVELSKRYAVSVQQIHRSIGDPVWEVTLLSKDGKPVESVIADTYSEAVCKAALCSDSLVSRS